MLCTFLKSQSNVHLFLQALLHTSLQQLLKQEEHEISFYLREHISLLKRIIQKLKQRIDEARRGDASHASLIHPKTNELRQRLLKWHSKRKASDSESRRHVIVICCTVCRYLFMNLCKELSKPDEKFPDVRLRPTSVVIDVNSLTSSDVQSAFETYVQAVVAGIISLKSVSKVLLQKLHLICLLNMPL